MARQAYHVLLFLVLSTKAVFGQTSASEQLARFDTGRNGTCPSVEIVERALGTDRFATGVGWTFYLSRDAGSFQNSLPSSGPSDAGAPLFAKVTLYQRAAVSGRVLIGWQSNTGKKCSWAPAANLLLPNDARLTAADDLFIPLPLKVRDVFKKDRQNQLTLKAVLSTLNVRGEEGVPAYDTPASKGPPVVNLKLFEHFSVYGRQQGVQRGSSGENWHVLLGKNEFGQEQLIGWVHEDDVYFWNSRMAAFWSGSGLGAGWIDDQMRGNPPITEPPGITDTGRNVSRYPVLDMQPSATDVQIAAEQIPRTERDSLALSRLVTKYRLVLPAQSCKAGNKDCLSAQKTEEDRRQYQKTVDSLRQIDVLFLIDGTESMDVYFRSVATAIRQFTKEVLGSAQNPNELSVRVSAAAYGDYSGDIADPANVYYEPVVKFHDPRGEGNRNLDALDAYVVQANRDKHLDKLEAPYAALIRAAKETPWRSEAGIRLIIHLADHGNRDLGKTSGEAQSKIVETVGIDKVAEALKEKKIIYVPVWVVGRPETQPRETIAREAFLAQAERLMVLRGLAKEGQQSVIKTSADPKRAETNDQRLTAVSKALRAATDAYFRTDKMISLAELCARTPGNDACRQLSELDAARSDIVSRISDVITTESGLTKEQIENIFSRNQTILYAWAKPVATARGKEVETLTHWIAMERNQLRQLRESFQKLCGIVVPKSTDVVVPARIEATIREAVTVGAGNQDIQSGQMLATALSLPFWERTEVLSRRINLVAQMVQTQDKPESVEAIRRWRRGLCVSGYLLEQVERGQKVGDIAALQIDDKGAVRDTPAKAGKPYDWFVKTERGEGFFYVPVEYLP